MNILIMHDDPVERLATQRLVDHAGHASRLAETAEQAWQAFGQQQIDMLIAPLTGDGIALVQRLRASDIGRAVYVLGLVHRGTENDPDTRVDDVLSRPVHPVELRARLRVAERLVSLERNAMVDPLTGLMNHSAISQFAQGELERARRSAAPLSLILPDLDNFQGLNQTHGSLVGDDVLRSVARTIREKSRPYDGVGRWAGDTYVIVLPGLIAANAEKIADRILKSITGLRLELENGTQISVAVSLGVVTAARVTASSEMLEELMRIGEAAVGEAKRAGGNQVNLAFA